MKNLFDLWIERGIIRNRFHMNSGPQRLHVCFANRVEFSLVEKKPQAHKQSKQVAIL
jgi:hypothetical protein